MARKRELSRKQIEHGVSIVKDHAHFVIDCTGEEIRVIDNRNPDRDFPVLDIIAVIGTIEWRNEQINAVLLEIGFHRRRPYQEIRIRRREEKKGWVLQKRHVIRDVISPDLYREIYSKVCDCMERIVTECRASWKTKEKWFVERAGFVPRGICFSVHKEDEWFFRQITLEHIRNMSEERVVVKRHMRWTRKQLADQKSYPEPEKLKDFKYAKNIARMTEYCYPNSLKQAILLSLVQKHFQANHAFLEEVITRIGVAFKVWMEEDEIQRHLTMLLSATFPSLPSMKNIRCYIPSRQPTRPGFSCLVFEIVLNGDEHDIPF